MFGSVGGQRNDVVIAQMIERTASQPLDSDGSYIARITSIEQVGDAATARVEEDGCWGGLSFVDFFVLARTSTLTVYEYTRTARSRLA